MMHDKLDDILSSDKPQSPSPGFASSVMRAVRAEAAEESIHFPWWRLAGGVIAIIVVAVLNSSVPAARESMSGEAILSVVRMWDAAVVSTGILWLATGALVSSIAVRLTLRATA